MINVKMIRKKLHLNQEEFAKICDLSRVYISNLENGKVKNPGIETIDKIKKSITNYIFFENDVKYIEQNIKSSLEN